VTVTQFAVTEEKLEMGMLECRNACLSVWMEVVLDVVVTYGLIFICIFILILILSFPPHLLLIPHLLVHLLLSS